MRHRKRLSALIKNLEAHNIDSLIVSKEENIFYLTSFSSDNAVLAVSPRKSFLITDFRYAEAADRQTAGGLELVVLNNTLSTIAKAVAYALDRQKAKRVRFEPHAVTFEQYKNMKAAAGRRPLAPAKGMVESLREVKDAGEIASLSKALSITKATLIEVKRILRPQATESAMVRCIKESFIQKGADGTSFEPIVAGQPGASQPHYKTPPDKKLGNNMPILIDMGAKYEDYNSDLTRMCPLGKINAKFAQLYSILIDAQRKAIALIKPGEKISNVDDAARQHIAGKGFGEFFGHSLGHGIGLETHEGPAINHRNEGLLREGMVFTIEPGIYLPGYGGLRIEDTVLVTRKGRRVLTDDIDK